MNNNQHLLLYHQINAIATLIILFYNHMNKKLIKTCSPSLFLLHSRNIISTWEYWNNWYACNPYNFFLQIKRKQFLFLYFYQSSNHVQKHQNEAEKNSISGSNKINFSKKTSTFVLALWYKLLIKVSLRQLWYQHLE